MPGTLKRSTKNVKQLVPKTGYLFENLFGEDEEIEMDHEYVLKDEMILLKGKFDLACDAYEAVRVEKCIFD